jgi:PIN domain
MSSGNTSSQQLETRNLCIDTSEYVAIRFAFSEGQIRRLTELAKAGKANVFITPVIKLEVESNIGEAAQEMMNAVQQMKKKAAMLREVTLPMVKQFFAEYERDTVIAHLHAQFASFLQQAQVANVALAGEDAEKAFELYFGRLAPFGQGKKKSEFPDAFIIASLDRWCREHNDKMYVITGDGAERQPKDGPLGSSISEEAEVLKSMTSACHATGTLLPLPRLSIFLELVTRAEEDERVGIARAAAVAEWAWNHRSLIAEYITDNFANLDFVPDDFESEVEDVSVLNVRIDEPDLIELGEDRAVLAFVADVRYEASVHTTDPESGIWDSEDKVMLFQEQHNVTRQYSTTLEGEVTLVVPRIEQLDADATLEAIAAQIELEDIDVSNTTVDVPIDDASGDSNDPSQMDVFSG